MIIILIFLLKNNYFKKRTVEKINRDLIIDDFQDFLP